jgi:hypothetical protein
LIARVLACKTSACGALRRHRCVASSRSQAQPAVYDDIDKLAGTWTKQDAREFERAVASFEQIDEELWRSSEFSSIQHGLALFSLHAHFKEMENLIVGSQLDDFLP